MIKRLEKLVAWYQLQFPARGGFGGTAEPEYGAGG